MPAIGGEFITGMANPRRSLLRRLGARSVERPESASYSDVVVIRALQQLHAREAIPALELLLTDYDPSLQKMSTAVYSLPPGSGLRLKARSNQSLRADVDVW